MVVRVVAAFDVDGTLTRRDTLLPFLAQVAGRRRLGGAVARHGPRIAGALAGLGDREAAKVALLERLLAGMPAAAVAAEGERFAERLQHRLRADTVQSLRWHQSEGHDVVLVSASPAVYLDPLGRALGADAVLATNLEVGDDGLLTGRLVGANVRGAEKVSRLQTWLCGDACELWAYGDSRGDRELLALADRAVWVGRRAGAPPAGQQEPDGRPARG